MRFSFPGFACDLIISCRCRLHHEPSEGDGSTSLDARPAILSSSTFQQAPTPSSTSSSSFSVSALDQVPTTSDYHHHSARQQSFDTIPRNLSITPPPTSALPNVQTAFRISDSKGRRRSPSTSGQDRATLTSLPLPGDAHNPLGVLAEASATLSGRSPRRLTGSQFQTPTRPESSNEKDYSDYYTASPFNAVNERSLLVEAPHIMRIITPAEAESLFEVYWRSIHPHLPCLDKEHSQPIDVACRSNFLFNASELVGTRGGGGGVRYVS